MKKVFLGALAALALYGCENKPKYVIEGDAADLTGTVYMYDKQEVVDSAAVVNGKFRFEGLFEAPATRTLLDSREGRPQNFATQVFLEPGTIAIQRDENTQRYYATGTPANDAAFAYGVTSRALMEEYQKEETTPERRTAIEEEYNALEATTVDRNLDNIFGVSMMSGLAYGLSGQEMMDKIAQFSPEMQQTRALIDLKTTAEQKMKVDVGQNYIDILQSNADGQIVSLASVIDNPANKYTLIDFWAAWCGPCMAEVPVMTKTYAEFHPKGFEIYGVSFDTDREKWLGAIEQHKLDWVHVSDLNHFDNIAAKDYAVQAIPTNFLIDAQGKIVAKNLRGEALYEKIKELLGK